LRLEWLRFFTSAERAAPTRRPALDTTLLAAPGRILMSVSADHVPADSGKHERPVALRYTSDGVSGASRRLRALAALSGSLTDALSPAEAADLVERKALSALDATSAIVVTLGPFPPAAPSTEGGARAPSSQVLHVVHAIGVPGEIAAALDQLPLDAPVPFAEVARIGEPVFLPGLADMRRYPDWSEGMIDAGLQAAAIVPVWANGELRGVLGLAWPNGRVFDEDERAFVLTLGVMCAQAIMRAHLRDAERTARTAAETARIDAENARVVAEQANKAKADFVARISHELRTPMNAVMGYTSLLADEIYGPVTAQQREHIGRVAASGNHLMGLIEDLLSYARIEAGHEIVHAQPVALSDIIDQSVMLVEPLARSKGLSMRVELPPDPITLYTDGRKLRQILINLLANAVKYSKVGEISLVIRVDDTEALVRFRFEINDHGVGMTPSEQAHAFDAFWQADVHRDAMVGTGLGLAVARNLARLLGGDLVIGMSEPGVGSTFIMTLPQGVPEPAEAPG
jgi:signal transduction histidine kinase